MKKIFNLLPRTEIVELFPSLNNKIKQHVLSKEASHLKHKFSLLHLNIRSPEFNGNKLTDLFERLNFTFSVIEISGTWLDKSSKSVEIDGFDFIQKTRTDIAGGGVGFFISHLKFKLRNNFNFVNTDVPEYQFIEIITPGEKKNIIVGVIYRPPYQHINEFLSANNELLGKISKENKICYLMGDYTLYLMNYQSHRPTILRCLVFQNVLSGDNTPFK